MDSDSLGPTSLETGERPTGSWSFPLFSRHRRYFHTFGTEFAVLVSRLLVLKVAGVYWGALGFGAFIVARRSMNLLSLPVLIGMGLAVTRYVALARGAPRAGTATQGTYLRACALVAAVAFAVFAAVMLSASGTVATVLFGTREQTDVVRAIILAVCGLTFHALAYGTLRGQLAMVRANAVQGINMGVTPLVIFLVPGLSVAQVVAWVGASWSILAGAVVLVLIVSQSKAGARDPLGPAVREVLRYGAPRVPGEFAYGALFALPAIIAAHSFGLEQAGFVGLGVSLLTMFGALFAPLGQILLPEISTLAANRDHERVKRKAIRLTTICVGIGSLAAIVGVIAIGPVIIRFMGPDFTPAIPVLRIIIAAVVPFVAYVVLRNVLDAVHTTPLNAKNMVLALVIAAAGMALGDSIIGLATGFAIAVTCLGALTVFDAWRVLHRDVEPNV